MKYIAFTTKGLEKITQSEILRLIEDAQIEEINDKRIIFQTNRPSQDLLKLKTVDDLGLFLGNIENLNSTEQITFFIINYDWQNLRNTLNKLREVKSKQFSITVGTSSTNIKSSEVINSVRDSITNKYSWNYTEFDHSNFDIRVFVDHKTAYISVRLTKESLHNRSYKTDSKPGSLKPTIAAAMVFMATSNKQNLKIVDNFCGSGTILCEALLAGNKVFGGDIDPKSVQITQSNLTNLGYSLEDEIKFLDATRTNWPNNQFDCAISNLPWDEQIKVKSITDLYEDSIREYFRILKEDGVLCVLVSKPELFIKYAKKYRPNAKIETQKIGLLGQNPTIVTIK